MDNGLTIRVSPGSLAAFCRHCGEKLRQQQYIVAENKDNGFSICLTAAGSAPRFFVYRNDKLEEDVMALSVQDARPVYERLIDEYLIPVGVSAGGGQSPEPGESVESEEEEEKEDPTDIVYEREDDLEQAMYDMLAELFCSDRDEIAKMYGASLIQDALDALCTWLYEEQGISVYRPTIAMDDSGAETIVEYPYEP